MHIKELHNLGNDLEDNFEVIKVLKSSIPKGSKLVECYETDSEIIVMGCLDEERHVDHNCDYMGCGFSHVLYRINKEDLCGIN